MRENIEQVLADSAYKSRNARTKYEAIEQPKQGQKAAFNALQDAVAEAVEKVEKAREAFLEKL